jgi:hypothetical protein
MKMKYFYRVDRQNHPIPGTLQKLNQIPTTGKWKQVPTDTCCDDLCPEPCPEPTAGETLALEVYSNGALTPIPILTASNSFDIAGGVVTLNNGVLETQITFEVPDTYGENLEEQFSVNDYNISFMDFSSAGGVFTVTAVVGLYGGGDTARLYQNVLVETDMNDDIYVSIEKRGVFLTGAPINPAFIPNYLNSATIRVEFPGVPSGNYDILVYYQGVVVHSLLNNAGQITTFNSNTIPGLAYDKIEVITT